MLNLLRLINAKRQAAGFEKLPTSVLRYKRHIVSPFETPDVSELEDRPKGTGESLPAGNRVVYDAEGR
jgi:hypothetical protein